MKNSLRPLVFLLLILCQSSAFAQQEVRKQPPSPEARAKRQTAEMKVRLNLDDNQTSKVYDVLLQREKDTAQKREQNKKRNRTDKDKIESLLSEEQRKEFKKMQEEKRERAKARRHMNSTPQKDEGAPKNQ